MKTWQLFLLCAVICGVTGNEGGAVVFGILTFFAL